MPFDDLTFAADPGWGELMRLARAFPLDALGGCAPVEAPTAVNMQLPRQTADKRTVSYERVHQMVDGAGDGPLIGWGI
jgi:hypothetical protein